jgi:hypothetical protein
MPTPIVEIGVDYLGYLGGDHPLASVIFGLLDPATTYFESLPARLLQRSTMANTSSLTQCLSVHGVRGRRQVRRHRLHPHRDRKNEQGKHRSVAGLGASRVSKITPSVASQSSYRGRMGT